MNIILSLLLFASPVTVSGGPEIDYQPSPLQNSDGSLIVAFERLTPPAQGFLGDILVTASSDTGLTWSTPLTVVDGPANQRHPALVHVSSGGYRVFYLSDEAGGYGIFSAYSPDGIAWTAEGEVDLGWSSGSFGNPTVTAEGDSALVMSYDRFFGLGGYLARSTDGGETWDSQMRRINSIGRLNRIVRHPDGTYLCAWQETGGGTVVNIFASHSNDLVTWAPSESLTVNDNGHDSMPFIDASLVPWLYYSKYTGSVYQVMRREVPAWGTYGSEELVYSGIHNATQPHPLLLADGRTALFWGSWWNDYNESDVLMEILDLTGITEQPEYNTAVSVSLYPVPFSSELQIAVSLSDPAPGDVAVYDQAGRLVTAVFSGTISAAVLPWIPDGDTPAGHYFIRVSTENGSASQRCLFIR
jgi:hypothetical protein